MYIGAFLIVILSIDEAYYSKISNTLSLRNSVELLELFYCSRLRHTLAIYLSRIMTLGESKCYINNISSLNLGMTY